MANIVIDADRCQGHGRCYTLFPTLFEPDEEGYGRVKRDGDSSAGTSDQAVRAVSACPERAIAIDAD